MLTPANAPNSYFADGSHPANLLFVHVLLQSFVEMLPPLKEKRVADELKPWRKFQGRIVEHGF